ncbi:forkhead box protein P1 [Caerostris darwini]|uniref:Forkhead box protein P1 n=1 Tax=Caerostris darwini TaxID=1538125 RepID=A0AAV4SDS7_9ARAC|nr:forkhead box protein P1 [Caerostris darwini]
MYGNCRKSIRSHHCGNDPKINLNCILTRANFSLPIVCVDDKEVPETGHGMMDHEEDGDVAINLSKNQAPKSADTPNGNAEPEDGEPQLEDECSTHMWSPTTPVCVPASHSYIETDLLRMTAQLDTVSCEMRLKMGCWAPNGGN